MRMQRHWVVAEYLLYLILKSEIGLMLRSVQAALPAEASGILLREPHRDETLLSIIPTRFDRNSLISFRISAEDIARGQRAAAIYAAEVCGCFHSHVISRARPSTYDSMASKRPHDLWLIYSVVYRNLRLFEWDGAKFLRRTFRTLPRTTTTAGEACRLKFGSPAI